MMCRPLGFIRIFPVLLWLTLVSAADALEPTTGAGKRPSEARPPLPAYAPAAAPEESVLPPLEELPELGAGDGARFALQGVRFSGNSVFSYE